MKSKTIKHHNRRESQRGAAMVEGALTMLVVFALILGIMDFGRLVWSYTQVAHGAREATRYAMVRGSSSGRTATVDEIKSFAIKRAPGLDPSKVTTTVTFNPNQGPGSKAEVVMAYSFHPLGIYMPISPITVKSTSVMTIQQ